jgi:hypothetical protein
MKPARIVSLVFGTILALAGLGAVVGAGALGLALATQRDSSGFFTTSTQRLATSSYALTSAKIDLGDPGPSAATNWTNATVRIKVTNVTSSELFVGIARQSDIDAFLAGVPHDDITGTNKFGGAVDVTYVPQNADGASRPTPPAGRSNWVAQGSGTETQTVAWHLEGGSWGVVVMNADGTPTVAADVQIGGKVDYLVPIAIGLALGGVALLAVGAVLIIVGVVRPRSSDKESDGAPTFGRPSPPPAVASRDENMLPVTHSNSEPLAPPVDANRR